MDISTLVGNTILVLMIGVIASYLGGAFYRNKENIVSGLVAFGTLVTGFITFSSLLPLLIEKSDRVTVFGLLSMDVNLLGWIIVESGLILCLIVAFYSLAYMEEDTGTSKFYPLLLLLMISVIGLAFSSDLFNMYLFFELLAISSFALVAFRKHQWEPVEAGIKFLVMSATGSALILVGIALVYKDFGNLDLSSLYQTICCAPTDTKLWLPLACFLIGFGIKAAMFPLHTWLPDAHPEAPSGISAMLSGIVIEIGLFALLRIFFALGNELPWGRLLIVFALLTMTAGNLMALTQKQLKRMLAYSSVAQMGYILLGIGIGVNYGVDSGTTGGIFHIVTHSFMKGLAFLCAGAIIFRVGSGKLDDMSGAGWRMPITGITFSIAVLSLAGVPPFSGFMSKLLIYKSGIEAGTLAGWISSIIAIFNSVLSLGYYLPVIGVLYSKKVATDNTRLKEVPFAMVVALIILAVLTIYLGVFPDPVRAWVEKAFMLLYDTDCNNCGLTAFL